MDRLGDTEIRELRVFLESVVCDLCRFRHAVDDGVPPAGTQIHQEVRLGPGAFADIRIAAGDLPPYFVEVDYGYSRERVVESIRRKYSRRIAGQRGRQQGHPPRGRGPGPRAVRPGGGAPWRPGPRTRSRGVGRSAAPDGLPEDIRPGGRRARAETGCSSWVQAIDRAKAAEAFGIAAAEDPLQSMLLWHFAYWRLGQLREAGCVDARAVLPPGLYAGVVVLMADLCAYSSYVRDTRNSASCTTA